MLRNLRYRTPRAALIAALAILISAAAMMAVPRTHPPAAAPVASGSMPGTGPSGPAVPAEPAAAPAAVASAAPSGPAPSNSTPGVAGMVVGIDPETGKLGLPSKADRAALSRAANASPALDRSDAGLTVVRRPDGSMMIDLQGRFQDYAVVRILPDGRKEQSCVQGPEVDAALHGDATPAPDPVTAPVPAPEPRHEER